ncbi:MAG TPA: SGNH/GDSL hydrolase family protein [Nocardioides sp.]|nr:SGNH/GDSL hydrolase family protein [Nocardioides sp.]
MTSQHGTRYLRFAALGDSTTVGIGDPVPDALGRAVNRQRGSWRGWARHLAQALGTTYDVSFCNLAVSGATAAEVRATQLDDALAHRPDLASLIVGMNDTLRSTWDEGRVRADLHEVAGSLADAGATVVTARFHDHGEVLGLPAFLRRPLAARIGRLNAVYDEIHDQYGGLRVDLAGRPELFRRESWSVDRFHPSELGHRCLARAIGEALVEDGWDFELPSLEPTGGLPPSWRRDMGWLVAEGGPWIGRRARDLGPWAARKAVARVGRAAPRTRVPVG